MANNLDDFDDAPTELEEPEVIEQPAERSRISDALKTNPAFKIFLLLIAGGALASAAFGVFSNDAEQVKKSVISVPSTAASTPGGEASPAFQQAVVEASKQRAESAMETGGSAMPTPLGGETKIATLQPPVAKTDDNNPLAEFRAEILGPDKASAVPEPKPEESNTAPAEPINPANFGFGRQVPATATVAPAADPNQKQEVQRLQQEIQNLMGVWKPETIQVMSVTPTSYDEDDDGHGTTRTDTRTDSDGDGIPDTTPEKSKQQIVQAGTISYGQMMIEANSDVPGPIMAQILSGPLAGAKAIGSFETAEEHLVIRFRMVNYYGKDVGVDILALDPDNTLGGLATEVDNRYWSRIILPAAAEFVSGFANSFAQADQSTTVQDGVIITSRAGSSFRRGLGEGTARAGQRLSDMLDEQGNRIRPLVRVAPGTPIGLFFISSVYKEDVIQSEDRDTVKKQMETQQQSGLGGGVQGLTGVPVQQIGASPLYPGLNGQIMMGGPVGSSPYTGGYGIQTVPTSRQPVVVNP